MWTDLKQIESLSWSLDQFFDVLMEQIVDLVRTYHYGQGAFHNKLLAKPNIMKL
jgi:hypothetical protein